MDISITNFIRKTVEEIHEGLPEGYEISEEIEFEISVTTSENSNGGIDLKLVNAKTESGKETIHKINFGIINPKNRDESINQSTKVIFAAFREEIFALGKQNSKNNSLNDKE